MKKFAMMLGLLLCFVFVPTTVPVRSSVAAAEMGFVFCYSASTDLNIHEWYYSDIFQGDRADGKKMSDAFWKYLHQTYPGRSPGQVGCEFFGTKDSAKGRKKGVQESSNAESIETGWSYSH